MHFLGPVMLYQAVSSFCNGTKISTLNETQCGNFTSFPQKKCYPLMYGEWQKIYLDEHKDYVINKIKDAGAYFSHVWNKMQDFGKKQFSLTFESKSAYIHLAKLYCPKTYETIAKYF